MSIFGRQISNLSIGILVFWKVDLHFLVHTVKSSIRNIVILGSFILAVELVINGILTFQIHYSQNPDISEYKEYVVNSENQIRAIQE